MASMPQWELPHTKVEQAHRTVGLQYKDFHICVKNQELFFSAVSFVCFDVPLPAKTENLLRLDKKKASFFILCSTFRNFAG